jgi:two-component system, chemotaxis family, protein-glutamate methylesterase/glutaminase
MENAADRAIVIGGSAGAVKPLIEILGSLSGALSAAVLVVIHTSVDSPRTLAETLQRFSGLPVRYGSDGGSLQAGCVYLAPPDRHMLVDRRRLKIQRGARENRSRPAIDPTLRTAARCYGSALTAVLLSGNLSDGTYGLAVVKARGGLTVVQDPDSAEFPDMPRNAIVRVRPAHILSASEIGGLLNEVTMVETGQRTTEQQNLNQEQDPLDGNERPTLEQPPAGTPSAFMCPDCGGAMWEIDQHGLSQFRCHVGHAFNEDVLSIAQSETVETALWEALRALEEKVELSRRLGGRARDAGMTDLAARYQEAATEAAEQARAVQNLLMTTMPRSSELDRDRSDASSAGR